MKQMNPSSFFRIIEQILIPFGLLLLLLVYCFVILKYNRLPWFSKLYLRSYKKKSIVHWKNKKNRIKWLIVTSFFLAVSLWGLLNIGLYRLTDPYTLIIIRESTNYRINSHLSLNILIFGSLMFFSIQAVAPFEIHDAKKFPYFLLMFGLINLPILWIPNVMNHLWYLNDNPSLSLIRIFVPETSVVGEENTTFRPFLEIAAQTIGTTISDYIGSYFNLITSTVQSFIIIIMSVGSIRNRDQLKLEHLERVDTSSILFLEKLKSGLGRESFGNLLSSEEIMVSCLLSLDETRWILSYFDKRYPGNWHPSINLFQFSENTLINIQTLISQIMEELN
jgi:hypothetical protein